MSDGIKSSLRARLGAFIATVSVLTAVDVVLFQEVKFLRPYMIHSMIALGFSGLGAVLCGQVRRQRENSEEEVLRFYFDPAYWGRCVMVSAVLTYLVATVFFAEKQETPKVMAREVQPKEETVAVEETPQEVVEEEPPEFPSLTLTGVVLNGQKSTALIDGYTVQLGESIKGVQVTNISEAGIVVEFNGEHRTILRQSLMRTNSCETAKKKQG